MSRAFVRETDGEEAVPDVPDRPVSVHPNFVTWQGLAAIDRQVTAARDLLEHARTSGGDAQAIALAQRDLRYWMARRATAEQVDPTGGDTVRFGATVTILRADGRRQTFRIVGEDEADPRQGTLSYVAPLARLLLGKSVGDVIELAGAGIEIVALS